MKLFLVHCGFYDEEAGNGTYELHTNFFTVAENKETAKKQVKALPGYKKKHMHVDGIQEITRVDGYDITPVPGVAGGTEVSAWSYDDLN